MTKTIILNQQEVNHKAKRIAFQIYEDHLNETEIILAGIANSGYKFAVLLKANLEEISSLQVSLCEVQINKKNPLHSDHSQLKVQGYENKCVVVVDDVLNSGATLIYAVKKFLEVPLKQLKTAVLVDRSHKRYPVKADYKGLSLSTSLNEMVQVSFTPEVKVELF
ncbi:MAG: phosphoribosyltransferase [Flavobacteriaceae bacterium]|nr:phosphoribosyltransferase [Flavobacteriaceae bacterium]